MSWPDYMGHAVPVLLAVLTVTWAAIGALAGYMVSQARTLGRVAESVAAVAAILERVERDLGRWRYGVGPSNEKGSHDV